MSSFNSIQHNHLTEMQQRKIKVALIIFLVLGFAIVSLAQTPLNTNTMVIKGTSYFEPSCKDAIKLNDVPEIKDSVKRIQNIKYGIASTPLFPKYNVQTIDAAKLQNEPLPKLYHAILKAGYGPIYNMPYGELWLANTRSRENNYGIHLKHFSSTAQLDNVGYGGLSNNVAEVFFKQFYKKHTLHGDFVYNRNVNHYYGYDTSANQLTTDFTRQHYNFINPKLEIKSHYTDSTHINHNIKVGYYNFFNRQSEVENNIKLDATGDMFLNKERFTLGFLTDFYNHKQANDTLNNLIMSLAPSFLAGNKQWQLEIGLRGTIDNFKQKTRFYFHPKLSAQYNVYENIIIPYAGVEGGLIKNSFKNYAYENPFVNTTLRYTNTNNKYNFFLGLKGNLSSNTSYDTKVSYAQYDSMYFYAINYNTTNVIYNRFDILYDNSSLLTVGGQLKYQYKEKFNLIGKGNYYLWKTKNLTRAYHKPDFDITFSGIYNLQSKIILKADVFFVGQQWALTQVAENDVNVLKPKILKGYVDANLEAEYRYSKMLSFFARFNNIANQRYFKYDKYPSMRFNFMLGVTFVPF